MNDQDAPIRGYLRELDGLRGIAITLVMIHRFYARGDSPWFVEAGWVGVDLFFVISGFLIAGILLDTRDDPDYFRNFYARRVLRIFPLYYLMVGSILLAFPLSGNDTFLDASGSPAWYLLHLGNVPEAVLGLTPPYWLAPVWSLAIEEQFYLTFPLLVRVLDRRRLGYCLVVMAVVALAARVSTTLAFPDNERLQYQLTLCRLDAIAAGCSLALLVRARGFARWYRRLRPWLGAVLVGCGIVALATELDRTTTFGRTLGYSVVALGFAALVLRVVMARGARSTAVLRWQPLRYLGKLCFGLYLLHRPADTLVTGAVAHVGLDPTSVLWIPVKIAIAVGLATLSRIAIEQPFLRLKERFASRKHPAKLAAVQLA
jgi:peptidoglycan/LPS O-acetylase OafA/YrhL